MTRTYEEAMQALRNADAAGNSEDARRLADIAHRLRQTQQPKKMGVLESAAVGVEKTIAGMPTAVLRETGILPALPTGETQKLPEYIGRGMGEVASFMLPGGLAARTIAKGAGVAGRIATDVMGTMARHPYLTMASELAGGVGMGAGGYTAEEMYPEHPAARPIGEMVGGLAGGLAPSIVGHGPIGTALRHARPTLKKMTLPFTERGATYRAGEFLKKQVAEPGVTAKGAIEPTIGELPPAVATGEKRLMALYKDLVAKDAVADAESIRHISGAYQKLEGEMRRFGYGTPDVLKDVIERRVRAIETTIQGKMNTAIQNAERKLNAIPVAKRKAEESRIVRGELERVMEDAKAIERELWEGVPKNLQVKTQNTKKAFQGVMDELSVAQQTDVPMSLKRNPIITGEEELTTIREIQGLRSRLLEEARMARSQGKWNKARISQDVADAILEDMKGTEGSDALQAAISETRRFKDRFERGVTGKILGYAREGAPAISPELTLDISIGKMGARGAVDLEKVAVTPEALAATKRYLGRSFVDYSLDKKTGVLNPTKAEQWVRNNEAILDKVPDLKNLLADAGTAQQYATRTQAIMEARKEAIRNPKISVASKFLGTDIGKEVDTILKSRNPIRTINELVKQANKDISGNSIEGLRAAFIEYMMEKASLGPYNAMGEKTLSGFVYKDFIKQHYPVLKPLFTGEQLNRMNRIAGELSNLEVLERVGRGGPIEIEDAASNILKFASRFGGAAAGRHWGKAVGAGGTVQIPGFFASQWYKIMSRLTKNRFENLVQDAILSPDGKLLESLLKPMTKPGWMPREDIIITRLNAWLAGTGNRVLQDMIAEEKEDLEE